MLLVTTHITCPDSHDNVESYQAATAGIFGTDAITSLYEAMTSEGKLVYSSLSMTNDPKVVESVTLFKDETSFLEWIQNSALMNASNLAKAAGYSFSREKQNV